jgi:hypothetical protein
MNYEWIKEERIYCSGKYTNIYLTKQMRELRMRESRMQECFFLYFQISFLTLFV